MTTQEAAVAALGPHFARYIEGLRQVWAGGRPVEERAAAAQTLMEQLLRETPPDETWIAELWHDRARSRELYRDPDYGFIQMGHVQPVGSQPTPHDHGPGWVVYGVYRGETDISRFQRDNAQEDRNARLEVIETKTLTPGVAYAYLPGQIHSPHAKSAEGSVVMRLLSLDLETIERTHYNWEQVQGEKG